MAIYEHDEGGILVEIVDYYHTPSTNGTSQLLLQVEYLYEQNFAYVDYKEFYHKHPEAVIAFFRRSDFVDYYPNGVIGTEVDHGPPFTIVGPLSPLLEEEMNNNNANHNSNIGGDEAPTLYEHGGESPTNQVSNEDEGAITNIDSLQTFNMKRHLPTDTDDENDSITTADDYEHETLPAVYTSDASPTDDNEPPPLYAGVAFAAECRQRVYQLDFVAAFLQADVIGRKFIKFPAEWKELLSNYPELHQWIGMPLRLKKSLYGDRVANLAWDETQSKWLTSCEIGFARLPSEESIYIKRVGNDIITILNAMDDQLYFATDPALKQWFEEATQARFDVRLMGQANWYLQSRITHCTDFSIVLDQSRYAALVLQRYLKGTSDSEVITKMRKKYSTPIPIETVFTKKDCSPTYSDVIEIQQE
jgi:hypothetical protein